MEHMRSSWAYDKSCVYISAAGLRSRDRLVFAYSEEGICESVPSKMDEVMRSVPCLHELYFILFRVFLRMIAACVFSPLLAVCFSVTNSRAMNSSCLNQKQKRKKSFINSLNAPSTQKRLSLIYISRNGFDKTAFAAKLKLSWNLHYKGWQYDHYI